MTCQTLKPTDIRMDGGTQPRAEIDERIVGDYGADMQAGSEFPPVDVFYDGEDYWLADGFHRVNAAIQTDQKGIAANVHQGTLRDAVLFSVGANSTHGQRRTNADKRRAVEVLLRDEEWGQWSDGVLAEKASVSQPFVSKLRRETTQNGFESPRQAVGRDGRTIDTTNIGKRDTRELIDPATGEVHEAEVRPAVPAQPERMVIVSKEEYEADGKPEKPPWKPKPGISPHAMKLVRGHGEFTPTIKFELPQDKPSSAVATLVTFFDKAFLRAVAEGLLEYCKGQE